ncbi:(d)CMP kinase [Gymnodinialimonas sp.]
MRFTVAIDGPAAAGKGTIGRAVADHFGFAHLDTGLLYRAVGARVLRGERAEEAALALTPEDLADAHVLRTPDAAQAASKVAVIPEVRAALLEFQRAFAHRIGGAVLDGRDIGTTICPRAEVKLFVTASAEIRAKRRMDELANRGIEADYDQVLADVRARDARDTDRATSPMLAAEDALTLDTSEMSAEAAIAVAIAAVEAKRG